MDKYKSEPVPNAGKLIILWLAIAVLVPQNQGQDCPDTTDMDRMLKSEGLVNVRDLDSAIHVELRFSTVNNPLKADAYGDFCNCYMRPDAAKKLAEAQRLLSLKRPGYTLLAFDCLRPRTFQRKLFRMVKGTSRQRYVANPETGSMHNYGCAIDLSIADSIGNELDMGTEYCYLGDLAQPRYEKKFLKEGKLTKQQLENRKLLRSVMEGAGFTGLLIEWWHFNAFPKDEVRRRYSIVE
jgi:D-alanyl-D-alanine dipeptidase